MTGTKQRLNCDQIEIVAKWLLIYECCAFLIMHLYYIVQLSLGEPERAKMAAEGRLFCE